MIESFTRLRGVSPIDLWVKRGSAIVYAEPRSLFPHLCRVQLPLLVSFLIIGDFESLFLGNLMEKLSPSNKGLGTRMDIVKYLIFASFKTHLPCRTLGFALISNPQVYHLRSCDRLRCLHPSIGGLANFGLRQGYRASDDQRSARCSLQTWWRACPRLPS